MNSNTNKLNEPILSFEFINKSNRIVPFTFLNPIKIITTNNITKVLECLQQVEEAVNNGYYAAGFLSYESSPAFDSSYKVNKDTKMPLLWFGIFTAPQYQTLSSSKSYELTEWVPSITVDEYTSSINTIKNYIEQGDTYQTNYTIRLQSTFKGDALSLYNTLKKGQASNYCAYLDIGDFQILSASPELFFHLQDEQITTRPMKGTMKRGKTFEEDEIIAKSLYHSEKNRAENIMIVDLLRNDLNRISKLGTVQVKKLFEIEKYPTVFQMTSTITGNIRNSINLVSIFKAIFPCGSITGAPKVRTMEIIKNTEQSPREVYCGAIGYITPQKEAIFNVPIRTVLIDKKTGQATYGVGGGITWDSEAHDEFDEVLTKARLLQENKGDFQLLESILLSNGQYFLLDEHLQRLQKSSNYFNYHFDFVSIQNELLAYAENNSMGDYKVRLLLGRKGELKIEKHELSSFHSPLKVALAKQPIKKSNIFLYHKTTNRKVYTQFQKQFPHVFDVLLWNEEREITEFTNGNVVLEMDHTLYTPPIKSGLLAGTYREYLIQKGKIHEKILKIDDLKKCTNIWFINSIRKWLKVQLNEDQF